MEQNEAISLLTCGVIDISQLSQEDMSLLDALAEAVHLWPLLLALTRGQLYHYLKPHKYHYHVAIKIELHNTGLTKNNIESSYKLALEVCIEVTLGLLTNILLEKVKTLILWTRMYK